MSLSAEEFELLWTSLPLTYLSEWVSEFSHQSLFNLASKCRKISNSGVKKRLFIIYHCRYQCFFNKPSQAQGILEAQYKTSEVYSMTLWPDSMLSILFNLFLLRRDNTSFALSFSVKQQCICNEAHGDTYSTWLHDSFDGWRLGSVQIQVCTRHCCERSPVGLAMIYNILITRK